MKFKNLLGTICLFCSFSMAVEASSKNSIWTPIVIEPSEEPKESIIFQIL